MALCNRPSLFLWNLMKVQYQLHFLRTSSYHYKSLNHSCTHEFSARETSAAPSGPSRQFLKPSLPVWSACRSYAKKGKDKGGKPHKKISLNQEQLEGLVDMEKVKKEFECAVEDLKDKFIHQLTVRTSQGVFDNLIVKTPDGNFPLIQLGQVVQKSAQLLTINMAPSPQYIVHVKTALEASGLNINPQQDGTSLFVPLPKVTREHRENLAKNAKTLSEISKKQLRDMYSKYSRKIKSSKEGHSADVINAADVMVQDLMHETMNRIEEMTAAKQQELMGGK